MKGTAVEFVRGFLFGLVQGVGWQGEAFLGQGTKHRQQGQGQEMTHRVLCLWGGEMHCIAKANQGGVHGDAAKATINVG